MTEAYTYGGNTWASLGSTERYGQTYIPTFTHTLFYIDLQLNFLLLPTTLQIDIYEADHLQIPIGEPISSTIFHFPIIPWLFTSKRVRFPMPKVLLHAGLIYAIVAWLHAPVIVGAIRWRYHKTTATYRHGLRIYKASAMDDWVKYGSDDHIFAEFGTPPSPPIDPQPPIDNFIPTLFNVGEISTGAAIGLATNVPCHLTCYWTPVEPRKHPITRVVRGIDVPWYTRYCFVSWNEIEQEELGDTLYHTFLMPDWPLCEQRWFTFRGNIDGKLSPSVGPLFTFHYPPTTYPLYLRPNAPGDVCWITWETGDPCPNHWKNVDDIIPDEDTTKVYAESTPGFMRDLYNIPDPPDNLLSIWRVIIHARFRKNTAAPPQLESAKISLLTHGQEYAYPSNALYGDGIMVTTNWAYYSATWSLNPYTLSPWTWQEIKDLQIGIWLRRPRPLGVRLYTYCTQVYAQVDYLR